MTDTESPTMMTSAPVNRQLALALDADPWVPVKDGDPTARSIFDGHYSRRRYTDGRQPKLFIGPGEKLVLRTADGTAVAAWRKFIDDCQIAPRGGVNMAVFRNEAPWRHASSELIRAAVVPAWERWPGRVLYTYVNPRMVRSTNPGYCYLHAGWTRHRERTKGGLFLLTIQPPATEGVTSA